MNKAIAIFLLLFAGLANAANIHDLDVGDGVYVQGVFSDELVYVARIDYSGHRVKVRRSSDGTTKWVSPSKLISRETSIGNDVGRVAIGIALAVCAFDPDSCANNNRRSKPQYSQTNTASSGPLKFHVSNECNQPVRVAFRYRQTNGNWTTAAWWEFNGNSSRISSSQTVITRQATTPSRITTPRRRMASWNGKETTRWPLIIDLSQCVR